MEIETFVVGIVRPALHSPLSPFVLDAGGCVAVPQGPGLGVELDEDGLQESMARPWQLQRG